MATVKFDEGTKFETSLNLEQGEGVIFAKPAKNRMDRMIPPGCLKGLLTIITLGIINIFKPNKNWKINLVITDRRLITIPMPPNKRNFAVESYYFKDMSGIKAIALKEEEAVSLAKFIVSMNQGGNSRYEEGGEFWIHMAVTAKNIFNVAKLAGKQIGTGLANQMEQSGAIIQAHAMTDESRAQAEASGASTYTEYSPNFAAMEKAAKARATSMDFSKSDHNQLRDYIIELVENGIKLANG